MMQYRVTMDRDISYKMKNTQTIVDDLVYSLLSEVSSRFLKVVDRKEVKKIIAEISEAYNLGEILVRKKPVKGNKIKTSKKKDGYVSEVIEKTRSKKKQDLIWEDCRDLSRIPHTLKKYQYCISDALELEDECALLGEEDDDDIVVVGIMNTSYQVRDISIRESKRFATFALNVLEENVVKSSDVKFEDVE